MSKRLSSIFSLSVGGGLLLPWPPKMGDFSNMGMGCRFRKSKNKNVHSLIINVYILSISCVQKTISCVWTRKLCSFISTSFKLFSGKSCSQLSKSGENPTHPAFHGGGHLTELRGNALNRGKFIHRG